VSVGGSVGPDREACTLALGHRVRWRNVPAVRSPCAPARRR
jgi:hypothetical protein